MCALTTAGACTLAGPAPRQADAPRPEAEAAPAPPVLLEAVRQAVEAGQAPEALERAHTLLTTAPSAPEAGAGMALARRAAELLTGDTLRTALERLPTDSPVRWIVELRAAEVALEAGDTEAARRFAQRALTLGGGALASADSAAVTALMEGRRPGTEPAKRVTVAAVLPLGGPPAMAEFARLVAEGVEVAAATALGPAFQVEVELLDDEAIPARAAEHVRAVEATAHARNVVGAVGFLDELTLAEAAAARAASLPLVSPTARNAGEVGPDVYGLEGPDPLAARKIAGYAAAQGYVRVAIVHSDAAISREEADAFQSAVEALGVPVVGRFAYPAGATFFEEQILGARDALRKEEIEALGLTEEDTLDVSMLEPVALFLPIPPEDVEYVAPQVVHFGLDTLAIHILGTSAWTDPEVLARVDERHTTGVMATAVVGREPGSPGVERFRAAYESHFRRSLVSGVPALGYDATLLLLDAVRTAGTPAPVAVRAALARLRSVEGATGVYSVIAGRVVPETEVVYIDRGDLVPIG